MATIVKHDSVKGWRVICDVHGELAIYYKFWPASRDARQHSEGCPAERPEKTETPGHLSPGAS